MFAFAYYFCLFIMSVKLTEADCVLISHKINIDNVYRCKVLDTRTHSQYSASDLRRSYEILGTLFEINSKYRRSNQLIQHKQSGFDGSDAELKHSKIENKKRQIQIDNNRELYDLISGIATKTKEFISLCQRKGFLKVCQRDDVHPSDNEEAQTVSRLILSPEHSGSKHILNGENKLEDAVITSFNKESYIIPPFCRFIQNDVANMNDLISGLFDFIVLDPPWWNKYVRRVKQANSLASYKMMDKHDMLRMPIEHFTKPNTLVAIWCTNAPSHLSFIETELLPKWNLKLLATWYWIKITKYGDTVCEFSLPLQKQPFEHIIIACHCAAEADRFKKLAETKYIYSVPSAIHSHKPPLLELFADFLPQRPQCLEIFARYLMPHFTSIGLEVMKLQNLMLYNEL